MLSSKPNEALRLGLEILELPATEAHDSIKAFAMVQIGFILDRQGFPAQSLSFYLQGLELLTEIGLRPISGFLLVDIGNVYFHQKQFELAAEKYQSAIEVFEAQNYPGGVYTSLNNLALIEKELENYDEAERLFNKALYIALNKLDIPYLRAHSYGYLGDLYKTIGNIDSAITNYNRVMSIEITEKGHNLVGLNHQKIADILLAKGDTFDAIARFKLAEADFIDDYNVYYLTRLYLKLIDLFLMKKNFRETLKYLELAYEIAENEGLISEKVKILRKYIQYYETTGNLSLLNQHLIKLNEILEKRYETDVTSLIQKIDTQYLIDDYNQRIKIKELQIEKSRLIRNGAIIAAVILFLLLWLLFARYQYKKKYHQQLIARRAEEHAKELEIEKLKKEQANRELVAQAANIQSQNDFLFNIKKQLKNEIDLPTNKKVNPIKKIISSIDNALDKDITWKKFEDQFIKIHPGFFEKLNTDYHNLTSNELKLCAYHKMNLDTKEIASLTALSVRSIQTSRYRLRKKLNIPQEISFQEFINQL